MAELRADGQRVLVTAGASGIGRATALRLAREGGSVVLVDRSELVAELRQQPPPVERFVWTRDHGPTPGRTR